MYDSIGRCEWNRLCTCNGDDLVCPLGQRQCGMPFGNMLGEVPKSAHICERSTCQWDHNDSAVRVSHFGKTRVNGLYYACTHNKVTEQCTCLCHGDEREDPTVGATLAGQFKLTYFRGESCQRIPFLRSAQLKKNLKGGGKKVA